MADGEVCIANIGAKGRRRRMRFGLMVLAVTAAAGALLIGLDAARLWRALLFLPLFTGATGVFQATEKT
jgi:hypothetical protein